MQIPNTVRLETHRADTSNPEEQVPLSKCHVDMTLPIHVHKVVQNNLWRNGPNVDLRTARKLVLKCIVIHRSLAIAFATFGRKFCVQHTD